MQVGLSLVTVLPLQGAVADRHGRLSFFVASEREVINGVQVRSLPRLKREAQAGQEPRNRPGPQAVADAPGRLAWEAPGHVLLGVRAGDDVNRLLLLLQRTD